ncbi:esterase/lipase family protein [Janthinobacterium sp. HLX7-2]|uniref:esterase/lipase family protein n=1 Tax=Janthinobacterium sp. HLX7-2 TaxID=1259331 RepID=UPI003F27BBBD
MSDNDELNKRGNHPKTFTQGVGGWAEYAVRMTKNSDTARHEVAKPPGKVIPIIFLPGVMGSNLRMSKARQQLLDRPDNRSWRPDDLMGAGGIADIATGSGLGGWFKNATPRQRQLVFDPNETEVEYYLYTEKNDRFDAEGPETMASDIRHQNVPDSLTPIPPLMSSNKITPGSRPIRGERQSFATPAQVARWRGWSEVLFDGAYGSMLQITEKHLNNMVINGKLHPVWRGTSGLSALAMQDPSSFGGASGKPLTEDDLKKIAACWYPVHAMGYNFVQSNGVTAQTIAKRLRGLVEGYCNRGFKCDEVILVTHSMGGLLARALIHPSYGKMLADEKVKILGIYHSVMPAIGAAGAYKRMRFGFQEKDTTAGEYEAEILGINGIHATAILANAPAPLEMMPGTAYGEKWLKVVDQQDKELWSWPRDNATALDSIYLQPADAWWRLINPDWVNPADVTEKNGGGLKKVNNRLKSAFEFLQSIKDTFHPNTYASYCTSPKHLSYDNVVFKVTEGLGSGLSDSKGKSTLPPAEKWVLISDNAKNELIVQAGSQKLKLRLLPASAAGDDTVPAKNLDKFTKGMLFVHGAKDGTGYAHQNSYSNQNVLASMLYSIIQIAKTAKWS